MSDEELALLLAREQEDETAALVAAVAASEGLSDFAHFLSPVQAHAQGQPDVDRMGYEELLELGERIGYAERPNKPTPAMLARLPTHTRSHAAGESEECPVCCDDFKPGDV